jgi:predicted secreted protein
MGEKYKWERVEGRGRSGLRLNTERDFMAFFFKMRSAEKRKEERTSVCYTELSKCEKEYKIIQLGCTEKKYKHIKNSDKNKLAHNKMS